MSRISAVAFDLWETILTNSPEASRIQKTLRVARIAEEFAIESLEIDADRVERAHTEVWTRCHELYWSRDLDIPTRTQIEHLLDALESSDRHDLIERLEQIYSEAMLEHPPQLVEGARETIEWCRANRLRTGIVSNTGRTPGRVLRTLLDRLGLGSSFDTMIFSNEVGVCKPKPEIFERLIADLEVEPENAVFIGDNPHADVAGAAAAGMRAILFDPPVRGTAVAPAPDDACPLQPWLRIERLRDLPLHLEAFLP